MGFIGSILFIALIATSFVNVNAQILHQGLYLGCYRDGKDRDLNEWYNVDVSNLTPDWCINECHRRDYLYAGVQYGKQCFCGNSYGKHGAAERDDCNMTCSGNSQIICGQSNRNSIYQTHLKGFYKGCFKLNSLTKMDGITGMPPSKCVTKCVRDTANHTAALKKGDECYCIGRDQLIPSNYATHCDVPCEGDTGVMCGGENSYSVYDWNIESQKIGCYNDGRSPNSKPLPDHRIDEAKSATLDMCINHCSINGSLYSGSQFGLACFCGIDYDRYGGTTGCEMPCPGNATQKCGAGDKNTVYRTYTVCPKGKYGSYKCNETCSSNCVSDGGLMCDRATGICVRGCKPGWKEDSIEALKCNTACDDRTYGKNCTGICNCFDNEPCDKSDGFCRNGCPAGYKGRTCNTTCEAHEFDRNCAKFCRCDEGKACNSTNGFCANGCAAGWKGPTCSEVCGQQEYGKNCAESCNCHERQSCNGTNGFCPNGCAAGFKGLGCKEACGDQEYGVDCLKSCNCHERKPCNATDGFCWNGCAAGYKDTDCSKECDSNTFGLRCNKTCHCANAGQCHHVNGSCVDGWCDKGWTGQDCQRDCSGDSFGYNCNISCNCLGSCDRFNGSCPTSCNEGWEGIACQSACKNKTFGSDCLKWCNCKNDTESCDRSNGACDSGCADGFEGEGCQDKKDVVGPGPGNTGRNVGISMGVILLIIIIVVVIIFFLRYKRNKVPERDLSSSLEQTVLSKPGSKMIEEDETNIYENAAVDPVITSLVKLKDLAGHVESLNTGINSKVEYEKFPHGPQEPMEVARRPQNKDKNRYVDLYPYEKNRIKLTALPGIPESEYINASLIQGFKVGRQYIAAQAPNRKTVNDFIRLLWEKDVPRIVMTTNLTENGRHKSYKYWPDQVEEKFGSVTVKLLSEEELEDYTIRSFELSKEGEKLTKKKTQYHFTSWPDHGVPNSGTSLIQFRNTIRENKEPGLTLVHCSAGVGRTGTYIALDCLLDQADREGGVEIKDCVANLRKQRVNMVQTVEQYVFIHHAILQHVSCRKPLIPIADFIKTMKDMDEKVEDMDKSSFVLQFEALTLCQVSFDAESLEPAKEQINKGKNRNPKILAANAVRPYLMTQVDGGSNYINAVYLKGYSKRDAYVITQMPLPDTVVDLWRLVYDYKISTIVMIDDNRDDKTCGIYWPQKGTKDIKPFTITLQNEEKNAFSTIRSFQVKCSEGKEARKVRQYSIPGWTTNKPSEDDFMVVFKVIQLIQSEAKGKSPMLVHCLNGTDKAGFYCVLSNLLEQIQHEQKVNIYQTVKFLLEPRPEIMTTLEQYKGYHEAVKVYAETFMTYANVC